MLLRITNFSGIAPQIDKHLLATNMAQTAINCRLTGGVLGAFRDTRSIAVDPQAGHARSIYRFGQNEPDESLFWLTFNRDTDVAKGQIAADLNERTFFADGVKPKKTNYTMAVGGSGASYPHSVWDTAIPAPTAAPIVSMSGGAGTGTAETRYYIYTYVTSWSEESIPSPVSASVNVKSGETVRISAMTAPIVGNYDVQFIRIYRTATGKTATDFQFVAEIPVATHIYDDSTLQEDLGEVCPAIEYDAPPDTLSGLVNLPNGIMAGFSGSDVFFSEPFLPFTFPSKYSLTLDYPVVGLGVSGSTLVAVTKGNPVVVTGIDPSAMSSEKLFLQQSCVSKRSIVNMGNGVMYASPDGLVMVSESGPYIVTSDSYSVREWAALHPETITACQYNSQYYAFFSGGGGLIVDPAPQQSVIVQHNLTVTAAFNDLQLDGLCLAGDGFIRRWDNGTGYLTYTWKSKRFEMPKPANFVWGQVLVSNGGPVTLRIYADNALVHTQVVLNDDPFNLPSGFLAKYWEMELTGTGTVRAASLAQTIEELQSV